jgi:hypothetical protein
MIIGRAAGKIKIKTDSPGLRAVECACCGGCGCVSVAGVLINGVPLSDILDAATTGTATFNSYNPPGGWSPSNWIQNSNGWQVSFFYSEIAQITWDSTTKNLCGGGDNAFDVWQFGPTDGCCFTGASCSETTVSVNGHAFSANWVSYGGSNPAPSFTFS